MVVAAMFCQGAEETGWNGTQKREKSATSTKEAWEEEGEGSHPRKGSEMGKWEN